MSKIERPEELKLDLKNEQKGVGYTYIGSGEDSPRVINFMGKQKFIRGELTYVTDEDVLSKIKNAQTFIEGAASMEAIHSLDENAKKNADIQREHTQEIDKTFKRKHAGE